MEKYFATYNQSLALKELGFDEPCFGWYEHNSNFYYCYQEGLVPPTPSKKLIKGCCLAPLKSQVFEWFRKQHKLKGFVEPVEYLDDTPETYMWVVYNECHSGAEQLTYEEAESACIDKLIEIVKNK